MAISHATTVAELNAFDEVIDVRSPGEFLDDHVPGAINLPVLNNEERARVGTLYKQVSAFAAKKTGAALVSRNIAYHLEIYFSDKPKSYRPLIYCWRGGSRSGSLSLVLQSIGFGAQQLEGGYKAYRRTVVAELDTLPMSLDFLVVSGSTGSGKSRLLQALSIQGGQVLDLEGLAAHRGSLLGALPGQAQPNQKSFESEIWSRLKQFNPAQPVFVESESKKIGALRVPEALMVRMRASPCLRLEVPQQSRIALLTEEYMHFLQTPELLQTQLGHLAKLRGHETIARWQSLIQAQNWPELVGDLLVTHYDPAYFKSLNKNYAPDNRDRIYVLEDISPSGFSALGARILEDSGHSPSTS